VHNGYIKFNNASLDFVLETLNHTQNMQFKSPQNAATMFFTGTLKFNQSAEDIAALLSAALETKIESLK